MFLLNLCCRRREAPPPPPSPPKIEYNTKPWLHELNQTIILPKEGLISAVWNPQADPKEVLITYQDELSRRSLSLLQEKQWLNDEVINAWIALLKSSPYYRPPCCLFSTFTLDYIAKCPPKDRPHRISRVLKRQCPNKIQERPILVFPVNKSNHWTLLILNTDRQQIYLYNSLPQDMWRFENQVNLGIEIGDSLLPERTLQWQIVDPQFFEEAWRPIMQRNGSDCGVMVCLHMLGISCQRKFPHIMARYPRITRKLVLLSLLHKKLLF